MEVIELSYVTISYKEPILYLRFKDHVTLGVREIREMSEANARVTKNAPRLVLTDARVPVDLSPEGNKESKKLRTEGNIIAHALVMRWLAQRLVATVYVELNKPSYPFKVFYDEEKAIKWLLKHKK